MKSTIDNGGQAYPGPSFTSNGMPNGHDMGMTLRDWFAGQALSGMTSVENMGEIAQEMGAKPPQFMAYYAYLCADAMIAARKGGAA